MTLRFVVPAGDRSTLVSGYRGVIALRWLGIALLLISALTTPLPVWLPGSIAVAVVAGGYNLAAMELQRRGGVDRRTRIALLCADFVGCLVAMLSILSVGSGAGPAESIGLLLIGVEAVMLFDLSGFAWFCAAAPPALALAAWDQARIMNTGSDAAQWIFTWATFLLLLWLIALRGREDSRLRGELRRLAVTDDLTGLANRRSFRTTLSSELTRSNRTQRPICLLMLDLDHFKRVNDDHGHERGDAVLREASYEMRKSLRSFELFYRLGGEEFLVLLPGIDLPHGVEIAQSLRATVEASRPGGLPVTASFGVSVATGEDIDFLPLYRAADHAMYRAKAEGRNLVVALEMSPAVADDALIGARA